ncbi:ankyrin repeat domain-containing protein 53 isoform X1 [Xiphophorus hellerii]|uniref:ankyrin repeat domain-containing protein 53 isoform X1 n=1 Tax=Xiphophorus hellerii TaxID=8084 RepID=UPI0013B3B530|nr:ankyrin repeat domain-containing protein 53 isoform X1 [Xiphophorus hellerii]
MLANEIKSSLVASLLRFCSSVIVVLPRRKSSRKASSGEPVLPDVDPDSTELLAEEKLSALHIACLYGELHTIRLIIKARPLWVNLGDSKGRRPLHIVLSSQRFSDTYTIFKYLMEQGADINAATNSGETPLHTAASRGLLSCTEMLVNAGADILARDKMGLTPLDMAHIWNHRKTARYLKHCLWYCEKQDEMEETQLTQMLYRELIDLVKQKNLNEKSLIEEKVEEWAKKRGLSPLKTLTPRSKASKYHNKCSSPEKNKRQPKPTKGESKRIQEKKDVSKAQQPLLPDSPWTVFGLHPEKPCTDPDLRKDVMLLKNSINQRLHYMTKWDTAPHLAPDLPLDKIQRLLFPRAFSSRLNTSRDFEPRDIKKVQHKGFPQGRSTSPWTEVVMHLVEVLELGHY